MSQCHIFNYFKNSRLNECREAYNGIYITPRYIIRRYYLVHAVRLMFVSGLISEYLGAGVVIVHCVGVVIHGGVVGVDSLVIIPCNISCLHRGQDWSDSKY